jgi:hypothetical protein
MKRIITFITIAIFLCAIPFSGTIAQEKKNEQKIKIVVSDGSGKEVVIDTLIKDGDTNDSIRIKGGKVIYIGHSGDEKGIKHADGSDHVYVYVSSDDKAKNKDVKTITIVSSDTASWTENGDGAGFIVINNAHNAAGNSNSHYSYITTESKEGENSESSEDMTRSIIAKDGLVVTVEGKDEAKVNELVREIENKMGVKSGDNDKKETVKVETKKSVKK